MRTRLVKSIKRLIKFSPLMFAALCFFASCASTPREVADEAYIHSAEHSHERRKIKKKKYNEEKFFAALEKGDMENCTALLLGQKFSERERIRQYLDLGLAEHFAGAYQSSTEVLNATDALMEDAVTKSVTRSALSLTLNESISAYNGTVYEYLYINAFNALNYYNLGNMEDALVEIRKINNKQREYITKYGEALLAADTPDEREVSDADRAVALFGINLPALIEKSPPSATENDIFRDSALARYLSMIFMLMLGDDGNARVDADVLAKLAPEFPTADEFSIPKGKGRLDVLALSGLIGRRWEQTFYFPGDIINGIAGLGFNVIGFDSSAMIVLPPFENGVVLPAFRIKFVYPNFTKNDDAARVANVRVLLDNGEETTLSLLEDFDDALLKDVRSKAAKAFTRSVFRSLAKKAAAVTAGAATLTAIRENANNGGSIVASLLYDISYISVSGAIEAVDLAETADTRQSVCLPRIAHAGGFNLEPGLYNITVQYLDFTSRVVAEERFTDVKVEAGKPTLIESSCIKK